MITWRQVPGAPFQRSIQLDQRSMGICSYRSVVVGGNRSGAEMMEPAVVAVCGDLPQLPPMDPDMVKALLEIGRAIARKFVKPSEFGVLVHVPPVSALYPWAVRYGIVNKKENQEVHGTDESD